MYTKNYTTANYFSYAENPTVWHRPQYAGASLRFITPAIPVTSYNRFPRDTKRNDRHTSVSAYTPGISFLRKSVQQTTCKMN